MCVKEGETRKRDMWGTSTTDEQKTFMYACVYIGNEFCCINNISSALITHFPLAALCGPGSRRMKQFNS